MPEESISKARPQENLVRCARTGVPMGESVYYPDSRKWGVRSPERRVFRGEALDYYDGEE